MPDTLSVVIPTLNAATTLSHTLRNIRSVLSQTSHNVIVVDSGSDDATQVVAKKEAVKVLWALRGRGIQLRQGGIVANGDWLLFLHADTILSSDAETAINAFIADPANARKLGYFRFCLDDENPEARRLEAHVRWRCRTFALPYGDQGFLINRAFYNEIGGFKAIPLMEDVDLIWRIDRRIGADAIVALDADAITSAGKFRRDGYRWRSTKNLFLLFLFWIKVPAHLLARLY